MDEDVELAVAIFQLGKDALDVGVGGDVALEELGTGEFGGEVLGVGAEALVLVADGEIDSGGMELLGDGPGDRAFVREAEDYRSAAFQVEHVVLL